MPGNAPDTAGKPDSGKAGLQSIKITFEFKNHDAPDGTSEVTTLDVTDTPEVIAAIQAIAIYPAITMITEQMQKMINAKLIKESPELGGLLAEFAE